VVTYTCQDGGRTDTVLRYPGPTPRDCAYCKALVERWRLTDRPAAAARIAMRWGHKSSSQRWAGYQLHLEEHVDSELITAVRVRPATEHDAVAAATLVAGQEAAVGLHPAALLGDGAFGTGDARAELDALGVEVVAKLPPLRNGDRRSKEAFTVELAANGGTGSVTCPAGQTTSTHTWRRDERGRRIRLCQFPALVGAACPLRAQCLGTPTATTRLPAWRAVGRTITRHCHAAVLHSAPRSTAVPCGSACAHAPRWRASSPS
jgi:hypothetical protein